MYLSTGTLWRLSHMTRLRSGSRIISYGGSNDPPVQLATGLQAEAAITTIGPMPPRKALREWATAAPFLAPNFVGFLLFTLMPVGVSMFLSFYQYDNITPAKYVGTANYQRLFVDPKFWSSLANTLIMMLGLPLTMFGALMLALALNSKVYGRIALRTIYYLPSISPLIAVAVVWMWIYNADQGIFNSALASIGIRGPNWLGDISWAKPAFIVMGIWSGIGGFTMLLYLAALQDIPRSYYEAAHLDGAGAWQRFRYITWPLLGPVNFFIIVMGIIGGFQAFDWQYVMTNGGPAGSTTTIGLYIYNNAFSYSKMGYASAVAWVLFIIIFGLTVMQWRMRKRFGGAAQYE